MKLLLVSATLIGVALAAVGRQPEQQTPRQEYQQQQYEQRQQQKQQQQQPQQQQQQYEQRQDQRPQPQQQYEQRQELRQQQQQQQQQQFEQRQDLRQKLESTTWIPIIRYDKEQSADGSYKASYETGNNIIHEETGFLKELNDKDRALVQHGSYSYTSPEGQLINVDYTADEHGFRATGPHIPTPPPVSPEIQKGLDLIYAGIKSQRERLEAAKNDPELSKKLREKEEYDYNGHYYPFNN